MKTGLEIGLGLGLGLGLALAGDAHADPDLHLAHAPPPQHLAMRTRAAAAAPPAPHSDAPRIPVANPPAPDEALAGIGGLRDPNQPVTFQIDAGYAIDGTEAASPATNLAGKTVTPDTDYARLRSYGFGDAYVGTHGVGYAPLQTFFAARAELVQTPGLTPEGTPLAPPIADWFTKTNLMIRSAWAELHGVSEAPWLAPFRARAGELYVYGPWVAHIRGALAAWEGKLVSVQAYAGVRAPDYTYEPVALTQATVAGASARVDLRSLTGVPVAIAAQIMELGSVDGTPATHHATLDVDWRPRRDVVVRSETRWLDGALANEHLQVRGRYKQVTNLVFDVQLRTSADWEWDPSLTQRDEVGEARRYLDLGPIVPQAIVSARAGTVLFDNIDLLARAAVASELDGNATQTAFSAPYLEAAGAADVRLRRTVTLGASVLTREDTEADSKLPPLAVDLASSPQPLVDLRRIGQRGFVELGVSAKMSLGARRFSAMVEAYGRRTRYTDSYCAADATGAACATPEINPAPLAADVRGGGRFTVDAWVNRHLRLFVSYDVSTALSVVPEITGYKALRLVMEGVY